MLRREAQPFSQILEFQFGLKKEMLYFGNYLKEYRVVFFKGIMRICNIFILFGATRKLIMFQPF